jgi:hypothetical protein
MDFANVVVLVNGAAWRCFSFSARVPVPFRTAAPVFIAFEGSRHAAAPGCTHRG